MTGFDQLPAADRPMDTYPRLLLLVIGCGLLCLWLPETFVYCGGVLALEVAHVRRARKASRA